ncbi:hypothetical protein M5K25_009313 [Dendrobium thyrsiflorum]|uniref:Uncharacterized protein n=1 Tax=Dendrobium thyrsiflorum TaxID=117978 RepID=A0ABD0V5H2_DENTH
MRIRRLTAQAPETKALTLTHTRVGLLACEVEINAGAWTYLKGKGKMNHLLGIGPKEGNPNFLAWDEANSMIMSWLWNSMTPDISDTFMSLYTVKDMWDPASYCKKSRHTKETYWKYEKPPSKKWNHRSGQKGTLQANTTTSQPDSKTQSSFRELNKEAIDELQQLLVSLEKPSTSYSPVFSDKFPISIKLSASRNHLKDILFAIENACSGGSVILRPELGNRKRGRGTIGEQIYLTTPENKLLVHQVHEVFIAIVFVMIVMKSSSHDKMNYRQCLPQDHRNSDFSKLIFELGKASWFSLSWFSIDPSVLYAGVDFCDCSYTRHLGIELSAWGQLFGSSVPCFPVLLTVVYWEQLCWAAVPRTALGELSSLEAFVYPVPASVLVSEQALLEEAFHQGFNLKDLKVFILIKVHKITFKPAHDRLDVPYNVLDDNIGFELIVQDDRQIILDDKLNIGSSRSLLLDVPHNVLDDNIGLELLIQDDRQIVLDNKLNLGSSRSLLLDVQHNVLDNTLCLALIVQDDPPIVLDDQFKLCEQIVQYAQIILYYGIRRYMNRTLRPYTCERCGTTVESTAAQKPLPQYWSLCSTVTLKSECSTAALGLSTAALGH